jgi:hypothetical protein
VGVLDAVGRQRVLGHTPAVLINLVHPTKAYLERWIPRILSRKNS